MTQRRLVLVREDRLGQRLEERHEALYAVGQRPRRDRQLYIRQRCRDPVQGTAADKALEQEAPLYADAVGRVVEQPRHRGRRHFKGRGRTVATPASAGPDDLAGVGFDLDLGDGRGTLAVGA